MSRRTMHHRGGGRQRRKWDDYELTVSSAIGTSGSLGIQDVMAQFKTDYGSVPHQATLSIPRFDLATLGTGTGTGLNYVTLGLVVGPNTLDAVDMDPVANPRLFWWVRKYALQNNSNPAGIPWAIQGEGGDANWKVRTRRTLKELDSTLFAVIRADFGGFTQVLVDWHLHVGILYP